ncbi:hypothetical protein PN498_03135 [Oscillatoria sp. CS-180]|uniref:hypothetical protein n=1 Tax=Oscillatoria sp. CS-180 TaxID=3021720 RepID=UPI00232BC738|nr:hypothetical protein [Oscillatoria sp. CS-180]MDB9524969.1 hypothetical protein [Oscillatoria sp. CS-180]
MEGCVVTDLKVHSQHNCYRLSPEQMQAIQDQGVLVRLEPGTNIVKLREGGFGYTANDNAEPAVLLWIYGGKFVNKKTNVEVNATWTSLNGFDDALVVEVIDPATLCAFFFDTHVGDNEGELTLSVVRI